jgi:hypothetical protein
MQAYQHDVANEVEGSAYLGRCPPSLPLNNVSVMLGGGSLKLLHDQMDVLQDQLQDAILIIPAAQALSSSGK